MKKNKKKKRKVLSIIERNILHILPSPSHKSITSILYYYLSLSIKMAKFVVTGVLGGIAYLIASTSKEEDIYRDKFRNLVRSMKGSDMNKFYSIMRSKKEKEDFLSPKFYFFKSSIEFNGPRTGYVYRNGFQGIGYYYHHRNGTAVLSDSSKHKDFDFDTKSWKEKYETLKKFKKWIREDKNVRVIGMQATEVKETIALKEGETIYYTTSNGTDTVKILKLHPSAPAPTKHLTVSIINSYDESRINRKVRYTLSVVEDKISLIVVVVTVFISLCLTFWNLAFAFSTVFIADPA